MWGRQVRQDVETTRSAILNTLDGSGTIAFTSGATEANNIAAATIVELARQTSRPRVLCLSTEHKSMSEPLKYAARTGQIVLETLPVMPSGELDRAEFHRKLDPTVVAVVSQLVNSETGVIQDLPTIAAGAHEVGAMVVSDITQAVGKIPVHLTELGVDMAMFSAHKVHGPKGIGALYVKSGQPVLPLLHGGGQERSLRPGTENVAGIVGFGAAIALAAKELESIMPQVGLLRDRLWAALRSVGDIHWNGHDASLVPTHLNVTIDGVQSQDLMLRVSNVAMSAGSACNALTNQPSDVLSAMGRTPQQGESSVRFSLSRFSHPSEIDYAAKSLIKAIQAIRAAD